MLATEAFEHFCEREAAWMVGIGLGRIVTLYHRSSTSYQIP
jgi:hypothetical protein